jgi:Fe-S-cluster containining protein
MPLELPPPEFERSVCACGPCTAFCFTKPGYLIPSDLFRIADYLGNGGRIEKTQDVLTFLRASKGAVVGDSRTGQRFRIGTITPRLENGRCVFLTDDDRCSIHEVSPFGCAQFSSHDDHRAADVRSMWGLRQIMQTPAYEQARQTMITRDGQESEFLTNTNPGETPR